MSSTTTRCAAAFLVSKYPDVSHTFILREVLALRERGVRVDVASINDAPATEKLTAVERVEAAKTFYVKRQGAIGALRSCVWGLMRPGGFFEGLECALTLNAGDLRLTMMNLFYFVEGLILAEWMAGRGLTHVHVHFATPAATVGMLASKVSGVGFSMTVHGPDEFYDVQKYALTEKIAAAKFVVAISYFAQSQLMKLSPMEQWKKFEVSRLGVDTAQFVPRRLERAAGKLRVLCVGRLVAAKGQGVLIRAVSRLRAEGRDVELTLVGDGADREHLEQMVAGRGMAGVRFMGSVNQDHIRELYAQADVFALASFAEGVPVVLMEAMAMEIPAVSTRIAGIGELIESGVDGVLVAASDVDGLAQTLAELMDAPEKCDRLGKAGRAKVQREYELGPSVDRLAEILVRRLGA
jgi:glycosyltransferase involved in cell wall biosynthesis